VLLTLTLISTGSDAHTAQQRGQRECDRQTLHHSSWPAGDVCPTAFEDDSVTDLKSGIKGLADKIRRASVADEVAAFSG
jgi:hypothetical protein